MAETHSCPSTSSCATPSEREDALYSLGRGAASRTDADAPETEYRTHRRFERAARLFTEPGLHRLMGARVLVFGMGGVGSFAAESLSRSAVGKLVLVDFDDICVTNHNRQLHALKGTVGKRKVDVMAERLRLIHPAGEVEARPVFYNADNCDALLDGQIDFVVDAIDNVTAKTHLLATCIARGLAVVSSMGAAARLDPTRIRIDDLANTRVDPFARSVRKLLKEHHGIECLAGHPVGVQAVFSEEAPLSPAEVAYDKGNGFRCVCPNGDNGLHTCERRNRIDGSASFVTGAFGLTCASVVVREIAGR